MLLPNHGHVWRRDRERLLVVGCRRFRPFPAPSPLATESFVPGTHPHLSVAVVSRETRHHCDRALILTSLHSLSLDVSRHVDNLDGKRLSANPRHASQTRRAASTPCADKTIVTARAGALYLAQRTSADSNVAPCRPSSDRLCGNSDRTTNRPQKTDRGIAQPGARRTLEIAQENTSPNAPPSVRIGSNNTSLTLVGSFIVLLTG